MRLRRRRWGWVLLILVLAVGWYAWQYLIPRPHIFFISIRRSRGKELYCMHGDGSGARRLFTLPEYWPLHAISPDGRRIAYAKSGGQPQIWVAEIDGSNPRQVTHGAGLNMDPSFFPDGRSLVYRNTQNDASHLHRINLDGTDTQQLTTGMYNDNTPVVSPTGKFIVFCSNRSGRSELYRINVDGSGLTRLTTDPAREITPAISPDGRWVAFTSDRSGKHEIYLIDSHGGHMRRLTHETLSAWGPSFDPNGKMIAYTVTAGADYNDICVMRINGRGRRMLTNNGRRYAVYRSLDTFLGSRFLLFINFDDYFPVWVPAVK